MLCDTSLRCDTSYSVKCVSWYLFKTNETSREGWESKLQFRLSMLRWRANTTETVSVADYLLMVLLDNSMIAHCAQLEHCWVVRKALKPLLGALRLPLIPGKVWTSWHVHILRIWVWSVPYSRCFSNGHIIIVQLLQLEQHQQAAI